MTAGTGNNEGLNVLLRLRYSPARMDGSIEGLFACTREQHNRLLAAGSVHLGEVLGPHSDISVPLDASTLAILSEDAGRIRWLVMMAGNSTICGYNPLDYLEHDGDDGGDLDEQYDGDLETALSALLMASGITDECENPDDLLRVIADHETLICHFDGGDAYVPGVVFARWKGDEHPGNPTLRVHLPPVLTSRDLALRGESIGLLYGYLDSVRDNPQAWRSLADELRSPSVKGTPSPLMHDGEE